MDKNVGTQLKKKSALLANEQTLLEYIRTMASVMVLSIAFFQFYKNSAIVTIIAYISLIAGIFFLVLGVYRYFVEKRKIKLEEFHDLHKE